MAQFVSERLGVSERLVPRWSQTESDIDISLLKSMGYMADSEELVATTIILGTDYRPIFSGPGEGLTTTAFGPL